MKKPDVDSNTPLLPAPPDATPPAAQGETDPYPYTNKYLRPWGGHNAKYKTVWTPDMREEVIKEFVHGATISEVVKIMGIGRSTFYEWMHAAGKEDFTETVIRGVELAKAWWIAEGRRGMWDKRFQPRVYELMLRNLYGWTGINPQDTLPAGSDGTEGEEAEGVRQTVDVADIIRRAKENALEVEYTVDYGGKAPPPAEPTPAKATKKKAGATQTKKRAAVPPKPKALRKKKRGNAQSKRRTKSKPAARRGKKAVKRQ